MPVKRSRTGESSSFGPTSMVSPPVQSRSGPPSSAESRPRILTLSSPVQESGGVACKTEPIEGFLQKCYYCKKKIRENAEVFMYSYLRAFCTVECRDQQIAMDHETEKASGLSKGMQLCPTG
ncbi:unnamed protein product [Camellia sinensis]